MVNDTLQSLIPAIYPILKTELRLDYSHIGLITLTNQLTASLLQPFVGAFTDKHPQPFSLALGMTSTLCRSGYGKASSDPAVAGAPDRVGSACEAQYSSFASETVDSWRFAT
jgi:hypothetical protein